jgi:hypothetical protein
MVALAPRVMVAGLHATFNAVNGSGLPLAATSAVVAVWALGLLVARRVSRA